MIHVLIFTGINIYLRAVCVLIHDQKKQKLLKLPWYPKPDKSLIVSVHFTNKNYSITCISSHHFDSGLLSDLYGGDKRKILENWRVGGRDKVLKSRNCGYEVEREARNNRGSSFMGKGLFGKNRNEPFSSYSKYHILQDGSVHFICECQFTALSEINNLGLKVIVYSFLLQKEIKNLDLFTRLVNQNRNRLLNKNWKSN